LAVHEREPCFFCERREREPGQILCTVCIAWAEVARGAEVYQRSVQTVLEIESTLALYEQPIMSPLADSVLRVCERNEKMVELLRECFKVVASRKLANAIEEVLDD